ncbi:MAG: hypothetical protein P1U89_15535 [Verrucomicrobiales bacterium]|nr:hypothetical protein [Verrucomicrobiales bacterium]
MMRIHRISCFCALAVVLTVISPVLFAQDKPVDEAAKWSETDSRLANHYLLLLQKNPEYGNVLDLLWDLYEKKNQTPLLMEYLKKASEPENAYIPKLIFAHLLRKSEQIDEARSFYDDVAGGLPENIPALKALAEISEQQNRDSKALSYYNRLIKLIPATSEDGVSIRFRKAAMHYARGQTAAAVALWNQLIKAHPDDPKVRNEVVALLLEVGETSGALDVLEQQAEADNVKIRLAALEELARVYELINDFEGANRAAEKAMSVLHFKNHQHRSFFERWVKLHERFDKLAELETRLKNRVEPENPSESSLYRLAAFYQLTADYKQEEETLEKLVERLPKSVDYRIRLAELELANDRYADSAETLDEILKEQETVPYHLMLLRVKVDLNAEEELAAEERLSNYLKANPGEPELRDKIVEFARANYLDRLVEKLLRESADSSMTSSDGDSAPLDLARFLHERGQHTQAGDVIKKFIEGAGESATERVRRLHYAAMAFRDLDMTDESEAAIDEALASEPDHIEFLTTKAELQVDRGEAGAAVKTLEKIWKLHRDLDGKIDVDQKIFSLLRANAMSGAVEVKPFQMPTGPIQSSAQLRKIAANLSSSRRDADNETPQVLIDYFLELKDFANRERTVEGRYRAAWWALKLQDNHEVYFQLEAAKRDAEREGRKPVVEVEQMLLELAVQNERPENIVRHLETLCKIDPANYEEYRHQWAEAKFNLGSEDVAVRELRRLAAKPNASLQTLGTLSKIYGSQGNSKKQIEVWENAYRKANLFEKRQIVRQLTAALLEQKKPQAALKAQMDLVYRETDQLQRRKQFESQVTVASRNFLLDWLKDRYLEAAQKKPFDRFFPEALGRIHLAMGHHREAFDSMKKAYYMSGQNDELLDELGDLASRLGDLNSAIYYSRQIISRGDGEATIENWENLIRMLEKDFRFSEADLMRSRLEVKFGQDPDFLERLATFYYQNNRLDEAHRVYRKRAKLRDWDVLAQFDLALIKLEMGDATGAREELESVIELTADEPLPNWAETGLWPLIEAVEDPATALEAFNFQLQTFAMIELEAEDVFADWSEGRTHPEFERRPRDKYAVRLRALEELGKVIRPLPDKEEWISKIGNQLDLKHEKWWLDHHSGYDKGIAEVALGVFPDDAIGLFAVANGMVKSGVPAQLKWLEEDAFPENAMASSLATFAAFLGVKNQGDSAAPEWVEYLCHKELPSQVVNHIFSEWRNHNRFEEAARFGEAHVDEPQFAFFASQLADWSGHPRKQAEWLDKALDQDLGLEYGGAFPGLKQVTVSDRYRACDSISEREAFVAAIRSELSENPFSTALTTAQATALFSHLSGDYESAFTALEEVSSEILELRPRMHGNEIRFTSDYFGWERLQSELRFYNELLPRKVRQSDTYARAFGGEPFSISTSDDSYRIFERFEAYRIVTWLNGKSAVDRRLLIERALPEFKSLDGRLDLARDLTKFGYVREAADIYYREVLNGTEDYAPIRGLFSSAEKAQYPGPALDVLDKLESGELPAPPGLTAEYINEQHARLLWHSRNIDLLAQLSQPPASREGEPPLKTTSHLAYQDELINAYYYSGDDEALLRVLTQKRHRSESSSWDLLLGATLLIKSGAYDEALKWLDQISYAQKGVETEMKALDSYFRIFETRDKTTKKELKWLSRVALQYRSQDLTQKMAELFVKRGETGEAVSLLKIYRRNEKDAAVRSEIQLMILEILVRESRDDSELISRELKTFLAGMGRQPGPAHALATWSYEHREFLKAHIAGFESFRNHREAMIPARLISGYLGETLEAELAGLKETLSPDRYEIALLIASTLGEEGKSLAAREVKETLRSGATFFEGYPEIQIRFFSAIEDRNRLLESHAALMRLADSYFFFGRSNIPGYPTLQRHWKVPQLLNELGHRDLATALYTQFFENIRYFRKADVPFLESYLDFLISGNAFETAERALMEITKHSIGFDLRKVIQLYGKWDRLDTLEQELARYELTTGELALVKDWANAVASGREMVPFDR